MPGTITGISKTTANAGASNNFTIYGTGFDGSEVFRWGWFRSSDNNPTGIAIPTAVTRVNSTTYTMTVNLPLTSREVLGAYYGVIYLAGMTSKTPNISFIAPAMVITSVIPSSLSANSAPTTVYLVGANFPISDTYGGTIPFTLWVDGVQIASATYNASTDSIAVVLPTHIAGNAAIQLKYGIPLGNSNVFTFPYIQPLAAPTITAINPNSGSVLGGVTVNITGTNFVSGSTSVTIGGIAATSVSVTNSTTLSCVVPAGTIGAKDVVVEVTGASSQATAVGGFTYLPLPTPTISGSNGITPNSGPETGGTSITITGTGFVSGRTSVTINGVATTSINVASDTSLTCVTPAGTVGAKNVVVSVTGAENAATLVNGFTYTALLPTPTISGTNGITPNTGPTSGYTSVTITGTNFVSGSTSVTIGGVAATSVVVNSPTSITCLTPVNTVGAKNVVVTVAGALASATLTNGYTYTQAPNITVTPGGITPADGPIIGGTVITIPGTGFTPGTIVTIGGVPGVVTYISPTIITVVTPPGTVGPVPIVITTPGTLDPIVIPGGFTYTLTLTVSLVANLTKALIGGDVVFTSTVTGGTGTNTYSWSGSDITHGTNATLTRSFPSLGVKTVTVTVTSGSQTASASVNVSVVSSLVGILGRLCIVN